MVPYNLSLFHPGSLQTWLKALVIFCLKVKYNQEVREKSIKEQKKKPRNKTYGFL
jgi:hypothetical protein